MKIAVISMGQFISSDLSKLKRGFTEYFRTKDKPITGEEIWEWMSKNLESLRKDEITLAQFCQNLNDHFKTNIPFAEFQKIFNSMVEMNSDALLRVAKFSELLNKNQDVTLILVSHTNHSHLNFILEQVQSHIPSSYGIITIKNDWPNGARILFVPSMSSKCPDHPGTLDYALQKLGIDKNTPVVSFLNTIQTFPHPNFKYIKAEQVLDPSVLMDQLNETTKLDHYLSLAKHAVAYAKRFVPLGSSEIAGRDDKTDVKGHEAAKRAIDEHADYVDELCRIFRSKHNKSPSFRDVMNYCNLVTKEYKAGNCAHQSFLVLEYLLKQAARPVGIVVILDEKREKETQAMVLIGDPAAGDAVICDPLHNQCYPYNDFFDSTKDIKARMWGTNLNLKFMRIGPAPLDVIDSKDVEYKPVKEVFAQGSALSFAI